MTSNVDFYSPFVCLHFMQHYYFHLWQNLACKVRAQGDYFDDYAFSKLDNRGKMYLLPSVCAKKEKNLPRVFPAPKRFSFILLKFSLYVHKMPENTISRFLICWLILRFPIETLRQSYVQRIKFFIRTAVTTRPI